MDIEALKKRAWEYVEHEANTVVISVDFIESFRLLGKDDSVLLVKTTDKDYPEWYVVGGDTPINLYDTRNFGSADEAFSFHTGIMFRMMDKNFVESDAPPEEIGYDAFISHASDDCALSSSGILSSAQGKCKKNASCTFQKAKLLQKCKKNATFGGKKVQRSVKSASCTFPPPCCHTLYLFVSFNLPT